MSIVYDFSTIKSRLRGDDWWKPGGGSGGAPTITRPIALGGSCGVTSLADAVPIIDKEAGATPWFGSLVAGAA